MTLSFLEIDRRWPGASVLWDRDVAGEGWEPVFVERDGVLWADCKSDHPRGRSKWRAIRKCRCRAWIPDRKEWWLHRRWEYRDAIELLNDDLAAGRFVVRQTDWSREYLGEWVDPRTSWRTAVMNHCARLLEYKTAATNGLFDTFLSQYPEPRIINDRDVDRTARWIAYRIMQWEGRPNPNVLPL